MSTVVDEQDLTKPIVRRKAISVRNDAGMLAIHDFGEYGHFATDEPIAHGGTGEGPSPLHSPLELAATEKHPRHTREGQIAPFQPKSIGLARRGLHPRRLRRPRQ